MGVNPTKNISFGWLVVVGEGYIRNTISIPIIPACITLLLKSIF